ncbi:hypothetical protein AS149_37370 [Burkholderia cenocepacia]|nr:hypothetical protein AS149_37370 [Burkholderia cenocepacia]
MTVETRTSTAAASSVASVLPLSSTDATFAAVKDLPGQFNELVTRRLAATPEVFEAYRVLANEQLQRAKTSLDRDQFVIVVDRNVNVQAAFVYVMGPSGTFAVGATPVSTGVKGKKTHFITPVGVVVNTLDNPSFRALGTKNSNGFRGYGRKGMRVWDFGWTSAEKGWGSPEIRNIRFQMHATDPDSAEPHLGHPASEGCVRVSAGFNQFADHYGVLDADYLEAEAAGQHLWVLPTQRVTTGLAGRYLVVVDSGVAERPAWDSPAPN